MGDHKQKDESIGASPQSDEKKKRRSTELSDEELKKVSGGIVVTKAMDASSTKG
jgi:bacteriocin-like protein